MPITGKDPGSPIPVPVKPTWANLAITPIDYNDDRFYLYIEAPLADSSIVQGDAATVVLVWAPNPNQFIRIAEISGYYIYSWKLIGNYLYIVTLHNVSSNSFEWKLTIVRMTDRTVNYVISLGITGFKMGTKAADNVRFTEMPFRSKAGGGLEETIFYCPAIKTIDFQNTEPCLIGIYVTNTIGQENFSATIHIICEDFPSYNGNFNPWYSTARGEQFFNNCVILFDNKLQYFLSAGITGPSGFNAILDFYADLTTNYIDPITTWNIIAVDFEQNINNIAFTIAQIIDTSNEFWVCLSYGSLVRVYKINSTLIPLCTHNLDLSMAYPDYYYPGTGIFGGYSVYQITDTSIIFFYSEGYSRHPLKWDSWGSNSVLYNTIFRAEYSNSTLTIEEYYHGYNLLFDCPASVNIPPAFENTIWIYVFYVQTMYESPTIVFCSVATINDSPCDNSYIITGLASPVLALEFADSLAMSDFQLVIRKSLNSPTYPLPPYGPEFPVNSPYCQGWKLIDNSSPLEINPPELWYGR